MIGSGGFAVNCLKVMLRHDNATVPLVVADPRALAMRGLLEHFCARVGLPVIESIDVNAGPTIEAIRAAAPDFVFSIYNMQILRRELLDLPRRGTVNFHNGPLPRYRGMNVYSWAIINGETEYGITWHLVDGRIDAGDILAEKTFPLAPSERPTTLIAKGFRAGVDALEEMLPALLAGSITPRNQGESVATYYSKRDLPNGGRIDFRWPFERLERFGRGLDFRPLQNNFARPTVVVRGSPFYPLSVRLVSDSIRGMPGEILAIDDTMIHVQAADGVVGLFDFLGSDQRSITPPELQGQLGLRVGDCLD